MLSTGILGYETAKWVSGDKNLHHGFCKFMKLQGIPSTMHCNVMILFYLGRKHGPKRVFLGRNRSLS